MKKQNKNKNLNNSRKVVRIDVKHYDYLKSSGVRNNRGIGGQANFVCEVHYKLKKSYPEIYKEILNNLQQDVCK